MFKMKRTFTFRLSFLTSLTISLGIIFLIETYSFSQEINFGPLFFYEHSDGNKVVNALGPLIDYNENTNVKKFGFRPIFYETIDKERNKKDLDVLFPFFGYSRYDEDWRFQFLVYLFSYQSDYKDDYTTREFNIFPFIFSSFSENKSENYFAFFPLYGKLKNRFFKDEISFVLFPLYLQTKKGKSVNNNILWPFFGYTSGEGEEGFKIWPIYGYRKRENNNLDEKFVLWPFYTSRERDFYDERISSRSFLPFFTEYKSNYITRKSYLWPFFNYYEDRENDIYRYDIPWPLFNYTRGSKYEKRLFPLYANEKYEEDEEGFVLWPLYRYKTLNLNDYKISRKSFMLFLYKDIAEIPTETGGRDSRRIELWPIFTYKRDREGNKYIKIFSILEPFLPNNKPISDNFSSFWRIYEKTISSEGKKTTKILWNSYRSESDSDSRTVQISPLLPLFEYNRHLNSSKYEIFGGLIEFNRFNVTSDKEFASNIIK